MITLMLPKSETTPKNSGVLVATGVRRIKENDHDNKWSTVYPPQTVSDPQTFHFTFSTAQLFLSTPRVVEVVVVVKSKVRPRHSWTWHT